MAGHSKWSKVKHQKAVTDVVKAKAFTKASRAIAIAIQEGSGITNPDSNFKLRLAIDQARQCNMPKENIDRIIAKASGESKTAMESLLYEAYGPEGSAFLVECLSENRNRTAAEIKSVFAHHNGSMAGQGAVLFQFKREGIHIVHRPDTADEDAFFQKVLESGAQDLVFQESEGEVITDEAHFASVREYLQKHGVSILSSELVYTPVHAIHISDTAKEIVLTIQNLLEELDDVQSVSTNVELTYTEHSQV